MKPAQLQAKLADFTDLVARSDKLPTSSLDPAMLGLLGEVGGVLTAAKKEIREPSSYIAFRRDIEEELGDTLWYLAAICRRSGILLASVFGEDDFCEPSVGQSKTKLLFDLSHASTSLAQHHDSDDFDACLRRFARCFAAVCVTLRVDIELVLLRNTRKVHSRFLPPDFSQLPTFDENFSPDEQLPENFEFLVTKRTNGQAYLSLNGVFVGDPLDDNIEVVDGYRFHDVFHMAYASILHWSPVLRALLKRKRKSCKRTDSTEDSGRAIVVEEGLTAWLFARAKEQEMFKGANTISYDLLKHVGDFVQGYEVSRCPLVLWERAILQGYEAFRLLSEFQSGFICGDRRLRTVSFRPMT
jgi:NTP pyrophosphatase (non-canonical NTP hydrolase)